MKSRDYPFADLWWHFLIHTQIFKFVVWGSNWYYQNFVIHKISNSSFIAFISIFTHQASIYKCTFFTRVSLRFSHNFCDVCKNSIVNIDFIWISEKVSTPKACFDWLQPFEEKYLLGKRKFKWVSSGLFLQRTGLYKISGKIRINKPFLDEIKESEIKFVSNP